MLTWVKRVARMGWTLTQLRDRLDLHERAVDGEAADLHERARGPRRAEELLAHRVDLRAVVDVEQVDGDLDDVGGARARRVEDARHGREHLARLGDDVLPHHVPL